MPFGFLRVLLARPPTSSCPCLLACRAWGRERSMILIDAPTACKMPRRS